MEENEDKGNEPASRLGIILVCKIQEDRVAKVETTHDNKDEDTESDKIENYQKRGVPDDHSPKVSKTERKRKREEKEREYLQEGQEGIQEGQEGFNSFQFCRCLVRRFEHDTVLDDDDPQRLERFKIRSFDCDGHGGSGSGNVGTTSSSGDQQHGGATTTKKLSSWLCLGNPTSRAR